MNDKELADKVIDCRIGRSSTWVDDTDYEIPGDYERWVPAKYFVRDWRVAGTLMEKMDGELLIWLQRYSESTDVWIVEPERQDADARNESLPRAIIEACVESLS